MKILVLVKQVPDTWGDRKLDTATGRADRSASEAVLDEVGERAIEAALVVQESLGAEVVVATMGPAAAEDALRKALAMGADSAIHVLDDGLVGSDLMQTAKVLAAVAARERADLVLAGNESTDGRGGVIPALIAEVLGIPHATFLSSFEITASGVAGSRTTENSSIDIEAGYPVVVSVTEQAPEARFPSFRGIMKAKKKPLVVLSLADLGLEAGELTSGARSVAVVTTEKPPRNAGTKIVDDGQGGEQIAEFLAAARLI